MHVIAVIHISDTLYRSCDRCAYDRLVTLYLELSEFCLNIPKLVLIRFVFGLPLRILAVCEYLNGAFRVFIYGFYRFKIGGRRYLFIE